MTTGMTKGSFDVTETGRGGTSERDAANYIAALANELANLAAGHNLDVLRYLLEMARDEAQAISHGGADAHRR